MDFALGLIVFTAFHIVVRQEERFLFGRLGPSYRRYVDEVPRWIPDFYLWREADELEIFRRIVSRIFFDKSLFSLAIPLLEVLERMQDSGIVPVLLKLP